MQSKSRLLVASLATHLEDGIATVSSMFGLDYIIKRKAYSFGSITNESQINLPTKTSQIFTNPYKTDIVYIPDM